MKVAEICYGCLKGLVEKTVLLSGGDGEAMSGCLAMLDRLWEGQGSPPAIANTLLARIRDVTGAYDPYAPVKALELERAKEAASRLEGLFGPTLEGALKFSALGNSTDFFVEGSFNPEPFPFSGEVDKIAEEIYTKKSEVLILGDNIGDFFFDLRLIRLLGGLGRKVFYAVREHPVQNDLSMKEVNSFDLGGLCDTIISTGSAEVGIREAHLRGRLGELWQGEATVIAKGMGNYETISEFNKERPVIHIMKIKCQAVAETVGERVGTYIAKSGGERNGR